MFCQRRWQRIVNRALWVGLSAVLFTCGGERGPPTEPPPNGQPGYQIEIRYVEGTEPTEQQRQAFDEAVQRWESVIIGDVDDVAVRQLEPFTCQKITAPAVDERVDDLLVFVEFGPLDGPGNWTAWGGPCVVRDNYLPAVSSVLIDSDDVGLSLDPWLAIHELGHALGFGEIWDDLGLLQDPSNPTNGGPGFMEPVQDATVSSYFTDQNFGSPDGSPASENLVVGANLGMWTPGPDDEVLWAFLKFDLSGIRLVAPITRANLYLRYNASAGEEGRVELWEVTSDWTENQVTWDTRPNLAEYATWWWDTSCVPECRFPANDVVRAWLSGAAPNYGFALRPAGDEPPGFSIGFHTRHAADPDLRPKLYIEPDTHFSGPAALAAFDSIGGGAYEGPKVPVESDYLDRGESADGHWRATVLRGEVMSPAGGRVLSIVTVGSLEDLGYTVDRGAADPYAFDLRNLQQQPAEVPSIDGTGPQRTFRVHPGGSRSALPRDSQ